MRRAARGLTLLEMLVTLVIIGLAMGLIGQAMGQFVRVERLLERSGVEGQTQLMRREQVRSLLAGLLTEQVNRPDLVRGDAAGLQFQSTAAAAFGAPVGATLKLSLEADGPLQRLRLKTAADEEPVELLRWTGSPGRIAYQDRKGEWHASWPVDPERVRRLPRAIRLELGPEAGGVLMAPMVSTEPARVRLADWVDG